MNTVRLLSAAGAVGLERDRRRPTSPAELAQRIIPGYKVTPTIKLISDALADAITGNDKRLLISVGPQEGKSTLVSVVGTLFALFNDPNAKLVVASYSDHLAAEHGRTARDLVAEHTDLLGFRISRDQTSAGRWTLDGHSGGLLACGITSSITGFPATAVIVDDSIKNAQEADSESLREKGLQAFKSTLLTRLHPGGSVVVIGTRWHESDLIGSLLREEPDRWRYINVPAVSEKGIPDALGRPAGVPMTSALGRTAERYADIRKSVGERIWHAMYQGVPSSPGGTLILQDWIDQWRLPAAPQRPVRVVVAIDPAEGQRDKTGLVAASLTSDGTVHLIADKTARASSDEWARNAVQLAIDVGASEIAIEAFSVGETYRRVVKDALARSDPGRFIKVSTWPPKGQPRNREAVSRAAPLRQALEVGKFRLAGDFPDFEQAATAWQAGQHCPDSLSAAIIAHDRLAPAVGQTITFASPLDLTRRITDRPSMQSQPGPAKATTATRRHLARSVRATGYDPLSYSRVTRRG